MNFIRKTISYFNSSKSLKVKIIFCFFNALFLTAATIGLQYTSYTRIDEIVFYKWCALTKYYVFQKDSKPDDGKVIFIDVSKDLEIVPDTASLGDVTITNRVKLATLFQALKKNKGLYSWVICDITFGFHSPNDSLLSVEIENTPNLIGAAEPGPPSAEGHLFKIATGGVAYSSNSEVFVKMPIFYDNEIKSLPVQLFEKTSLVNFTNENGLTYENGRLAFNTITPSLFYRKFDLRRDNNVGKPNLVYLNQIILDHDFFDHYLKGRSIVIGDFSTDIHETYLGTTYGPLILYNTWLTLKDKSIAISYTWLGLLLILYCLVSYFFVFNTKNKSSDPLRKIKSSPIKGLFKKYLSFTTLLMLMNVVSYFVFGIFISLFYIASYLTILGLIFEKVRQFGNSRNLQSFIRKNI